MNREGSIYDAHANELQHLTHFCEFGKKLGMFGS